MNVLSFFRDRGRKRAAALYDQGRALIEEEEFEAALAIGRKLRKLRFSGAYEIEGLAYSGLDRDDDAVRVLREGLAIEPSVWVNWLLLGSCLSRLGNYDEALLAYDRAQASPQSDRDMVELNRAIVGIRREDYAFALRHLDAIHSYENAPARLRAIGCRVRALQGLGRVAQAEDLGLRTLREWRDTNDGEGKSDIAEIALVLGEIRLGRGDDREAVLAHAIEWWRATRQERLLWLVREAQPLRSPESHYFRLLLHGTISPGSDVDVDAQGFYSSADVVADSPEEALAFVLQLDPPERGVEVTVHEANALEPRPNGPKGVYAAPGGRTYYRGDQ